EDYKIPYALCSFTGKAVTRIKEVVPKAKAFIATMHRMIASPMSVVKFNYLIIDECSMVTTELLYEFIDVFGTDFSIVLIGDANQLPPISWGSLFNEILLSRTVHKTILRINHRVYDVEGEVDGIIPNCERIANWRNGAAYGFVDANNVVLMPGPETQVMDLVTMFSKHGLKSSNIIVISPYNKYLDVFNKGVQAIYNGTKARITDPHGSTWHIDDRVMMMMNNYDVDVMNGETGVVTEICHLDDKLGCGA